MLSRSRFGEQLLSPETNPLPSGSSSLPKRMCFFLSGLRRVEDLKENMRHLFFGSCLHVVSEDQLCSGLGMSDLLRRDPGAEGLFLLLFDSFHLGNLSFRLFGNAVGEDESFISGSGARGDLLYGYPFSL